MLRRHCLSVGVFVPAKTVALPAAVCLSLARFNTTKSKAAVDALRRSAELNTGEAARQAAASSSGMSARVVAAPPAGEIDAERGGFKVVENNPSYQQFEGIMKKGEDDRKSGGDTLPCDSTNSAEDAAAAKAAEIMSAASAAPPKGGVRATPSAASAASSSALAGAAKDAHTAAAGAPNWQDKKKLWKSLKDKQTEFLSEEVNQIPVVNELEWMRIEKELKNEDRFHWRIGQIGLDDEQLRNDYYALHFLSLKLNKTRWYMMDIANKKGQNTTAIGMRGLFWKESCTAIIEAGCMTRGQFVDSHPVLRPFGEAMQRRRFTKAFARGFVEARLRVMDQPANMQQLFDHFDRFHGHFLCMQLELLGVKSEVAEHIMIHLGRAIGITQHCVMLWRDYARLGRTLLPADICAQNHVNLSLLRNIRLATTDTCVRRVLLEVMNQVRAEMLHVKQLVPLYPTAAWPLLIEAVYPAFYLSFLERHEFDITKRFADQNHFTYGFYWHMQKAMLRWTRTKDLSVFVESDMPAVYSPNMWSTASNTTDAKVKEAEETHQKCKSWN